MTILFNVELLTFELFIVVELTVELFMVILAILLVHSGSLDPLLIKICPSVPTVV